MGSRKPRKEGGAAFPAAPVAAACALGCPHQLPLPISSLLGLCSELGEPGHLPAARGDAWALLLSQEPEVGTKRLRSRTGGSRTIWTTGLGPAGPWLPRKSWCPSLSSGSNGLTPSNSNTRGSPASDSPSSPGGPPHHALSHHPVTEALLTATSQLVRKGHAEGGGKDRPRDTGGLAAFSNRDAPCRRGHLLPP